MAAASATGSCFSESFISEFEGSGAFLSESILSSSVASGDCLSVEVVSVEGMFWLAATVSVEFVTAILSDFSDEVVLRSGIMVDAVAGDVWFGSDSLLSVASDDNDVFVSSGCEIVSAVAGNGVLSEAFSLVVDVVITGEVIGFGLVGVC